jgi:hypothetical protein
MNCNELQFETRLSSGKKNLIGYLRLHEECMLPLRSCS